MSKTSGITRIDFAIFLVLCYASAIVGATLAQI